MRCHAFRENDAFILCAEDVPPALTSVVEGAYFQQEGDRFVKRFSSSVEDQDQVARNFPRLAPAMFAGQDADWEAALMTFADCCADAGIEWYVTGSACDAVRGVPITPHDLDLVIHTGDFWRARDAFRPEMVEPFVDNSGTWVVRYFGRICLANVQVDVVADPSRDADAHHYETVEWHGSRIKVEPFEVRHRTEIERGRHDRIAAFDAFLRENPDRATAGS
ncbi:MAG TPA: hypothetical protein VGR08_05245 [Thermomicrobiales bacterium]|nr:hypothetical protein [Thermomicrobiales bacterium]